MTDQDIRQSNNGFVGLFEFSNRDINYVYNYTFSYLGTSRLCQHNFEHNRSLKALSIMPA